MWRKREGGHRVCRQAVKTTPLRRRQRQPPQESIQLYDNDPEPPPSERRREESPLSHSGWLAKKQLLICISPRPLPRSTCSRRPCACRRRHSGLARAAAAPNRLWQYAREWARERDAGPKLFIDLPAPHPLPLLTPGPPQAVAWPPAFTFIHEGACDLA